jgi:hypothetical protein
VFELVPSEAAVLRLAPWPFLEGQEGQLGEKEILLIWTAAYWEARTDRWWTWFMQVIPEDDDVFPLLVSLI